jgi:hypothetical protein
MQNHTKKEQHKVLPSKIANDGVSLIHYKPLCLQRDITFLYLVKMDLIGPDHLNCRMLGVPLLTHMR